MAGEALISSECGVLAFDIETLGLSPEALRGEGLALGKGVSVAAVWDSSGGRCYNFIRSDDDAENQAQKDKFMEELDRAQTLVAYNGSSFDLPFVATEFCVDRGRLQAWQFKTFDPLSIVRLCYGQRLKLSQMLKQNELDSKIASGLEAIKWAKECNWPDLEVIPSLPLRPTTPPRTLQLKGEDPGLAQEYCIEDARLTYQLCMLPEIRLAQLGNCPLGNRQFLMCGRLGRAPYAGGARCWVHTEAGGPEQ